MSFISFFLIFLSFITIESAIPPFKWRTSTRSTSTSIQIQQGQEFSSPSTSSICSIQSNATISTNLQCISNITIWNTLIQQWDELSSLHKLLNTSKCTLFVPTNDAVQNGLFVMMHTFGIRLSSGQEKGSIEIPSVSPPIDNLLKQLSQSQQMNTMSTDMSESSDMSEVASASIYYNLSYPFPPPSMMLNITLTPQQILSIVKRLPRPLRSLLVSAFSYHVIPHHILARNTTCFMQAVPTAMESDQVEQVDGSQRLLLQNWRNGMNSTEYLQYLHARHDVVERALDPTLPSNDLRILAGTHGSRYNVDPIITDLISSNGVIHVVDKVIMMPPSVIGYLVMMHRTTSHFAKAIVYHGRSLLKYVQSRNSTVFIPTNYAFDRHGINPYFIHQHQWERIVREHVAQGVHVLIPAVGNTTHCNTTELPLKLTSLSNGALTITSNPSANYTFYVNNVPMIDDNVLISNGVVHVVDDLLISPSLLDELRGSKLPFPSPPCPESNQVCNISNTTRLDQHFNVCYNITTHVCINGTFLCPVQNPLVCISNTTLNCYHPSQYSCVPQTNGLSILVPVPPTPVPTPLPTPVLTPPILTPVPTVPSAPTSAPAPTTPPQPLTPPSG